MSRIVSIEIWSPSTEIAASRILSCLLDHGWNLDHQGKITYLPVGDKDDFSWEWMDISQKEILAGIIADKEKAEEIVGVVIFNEKDPTGGQLLIHPSEEMKGQEIRRIDFILDANRKKLDNAFELTDVSWYLPRYIPALMASGINICNVQWEEII